MNRTEESSANIGKLTAIILAASDDTSVFGPKGFPICMLPLGSKPALQHGVEVAVAAGARDVHVVVSEATEVVGAFLKKGERWGVEAQTHLARNISMSYVHLSTVAAASPENTYLVLHCDTLPLAIPEDALRNHESVTLLTHADEWTGAAIINGASIPAFSECSREEFEAFLTQHGGQTVEVAQPLSIQTGASLLESQDRVLSEDCILLTQNLRTAEPGIWIGRNTRLHPTTRLHPPVMIGANCDISAHVDIGPNVVVSDHCIIDKAVNARNSLVLEHTAIGEGLELNDVILAGQRLHNARINATIDVRDNTLLGDLSRRDLRESLWRLGSKLTAAALLVVCLPFLLVALLYLKLRGKFPRLVEREIVETPAMEHPELWKSLPIREVQTGRTAAEKTAPSSSASLMWQDLLKRVVPGCWAVVRGAISLTGVSLRDEAEFKQVPSYWRRDLLQTRSGLISESLVQYGPHATADQSCTADMWYAMAPGRAKQFRLLARYVRALIQGPLAVELVDQSQEQPATEQVGRTRTYANSKEVCDVECV